MRVITGENAKRVEEKFCSACILRQGDIQECRNYRDINLMSHSMKIWKNILEKRIRSETQISVIKNQISFLPGKSDVAVILSEIVCREENNLCIMFIALKKCSDIHSEFF